MINGVVVFKYGFNFNHPQKIVLLLRTVIDVESNDGLVRGNITV